MRRTLSDVVISVIALATLLMLLVTVDPRLREQVGNAINAPGASFDTVVSQLRGISRTAFDAVGDQSFANAPMMIFAVVAVVLVLFMLRT